MSRLCVRALSWENFAFARRGHGFEPLTLRCWKREPATQRWPFRRCNGPLSSLLSTDEPCGFRGLHGLTTATQWPHVAMLNPVDHVFCLGATVRNEVIALG